MFNLSRCSWLVFILLLASCSSSNSPPADSDGTDPTGSPDSSPTGADGTAESLPVARLDIREDSELYPYRSDSPYAAVLKNCALIDDYTQACTLDTLPFITQANPDFTREDILDRLLVTHAWMGDRFEALLNDAPETMIPLFGAITSISIGSTIRPTQ